MNKTSNILWGIFLIAIGVLFLVGKFYDLRFFDISMLWPLLILVPGLLFELSFFISKKDPGLLVPGGILTTIGIVFLVNNIAGHNIIRYLWPFFPMSVAIGLFQLYLFTDRHWALLIPVGIIGGLSMIFLASILMDMSLGILFVAAIFIIAGIFIILGGARKKQD